MEAWKVLSEWRDVPHCLMSDVHVYASIGAEVRVFASAQTQQKPRRNQWFTLFILNKHGGESSSLTNLYDGWIIILRSVGHFLP